MKIKFIAAACIALCSSSAFAATAKLACNPATPVMSINTCVPGTTLYVAGSSALGGALGAVVVADLFDAGSVITQVKDTNSANGTTGTNGVSAWFGASAADKTKTLFVVYNKQNGSAAGVSQLLSTTKDITIPEQDVVTIGPVSGAANTCTANADIVATATTPLFHSVTCFNHGRTQADMALSDVAPAELVALEGAAPAALTTIASSPVGIQGFGVAVSNDLYVAMQTAQNTGGQPSIRRADYASLVSTQGSIKSAAKLLGNSDATKLTLARRDQLSGTQAASNIFFADNACGVNHDAKGKVIAGVLGGALDLVRAQDSATFAVTESATGGGVTGTLNAAGYAIGVISLTSVPAATGWKFVKIDGVSPDFNADGSAAYKQRTAFANGDYAFAMASVAVTPVKPAAGKAAFTAQIIAGLKDSTLHDLTGIAYLDGAANDSSKPKQALVHRTAGNNCSPLIK